jgi:hypothetical protein
MEPPPDLPRKTPLPLGKKFVITLLCPVAGMAVAALASLGGRDAEGMAYGLSILSLPVMLFCSIICAVWIGQRRGAGMGFLGFLGIQVFYIAVAFGGCAAVLSNRPMNFH